MNLVPIRQPRHVFLRGGRMARIGKRVVSYAPVLGLALALDMSGLSPLGAVTPASANCLVNGTPGTVGTTGDDTVDCDAANTPGPGTSFDALAGDDTFNLKTGATLGVIFGREGKDIFKLEGAAVNGTIYGNVGNDEIYLISGTVIGSDAGTAINLAENDDKAELSGATIIGNLRLGADEDTFTMTGGRLQGNLQAEGSKDTLTLNGGTITGNVVGGSGPDTITLGGTIVMGDIIASNSGSGEATETDTIKLLSGSVNNVNLGIGDDTGEIAAPVMVTGSLIFGSGTDTVTMTGGTVQGDIFFGDSMTPTTADADSFTMSGGTVGGSVIGDNGVDKVTVSGTAATGTVNLHLGNDEFTLGGSAVVNGDVFLGDGNDKVDLLGGTVFGRVSGDAGSDTITLNGATLVNLNPADPSGLGGRINGGGGVDYIYLKSGSAHWVAGNDGKDEIYLQGALIADTIAGNDGDDTFEWTSGNFARFSGGDGADTVTITASEYNSTQQLFGGNVASDRQGNDTLNFDGVTSPALNGEVSGWQVVNLRGNSVIGLRNRSSSDFGDMFIEAGSRLVATEGLRIDRDLTAPGTVDLSSGVAGNVMDVGGNFAGGGTLIIDAALGGSPQVADVLHVRGNVTGKTRLVVNNAGAAGVATTGDGILVVRVDGTETPAADAFFLPGPLVSGAYSYVLDYGGAADSNKNFYLVSLGVNPDGELYSVAPALISSAFADLPGLVRRYAGRVETGQSVARVGAGLQAVSRDTAGLSTGFASGPLLGAPGPWVQLEGGRDRAQSSDDGQYETDRFALKAGFDADAELWGPGRLIAGAYVSIGRSEETVNNPLGSASMTSDAYGIGLTATYYTGGGSYMDLQGIVMRVDSDLDVKSGVLSTAAAGSIELGHMFSLGNGASLIPSLQYQYGNVSASSFTDDLGSRITGFGDDASTGRVGVALQTPVMDGPVLTASVDYIHEFSPEVGVTVGAAEVSGDLPENWVEGGLGLDWQVGEASYLNLRASYAGAIGEDLADNSSLSASVNFSVAF